MSPESRMMNPGNARPFLNHYSLFIVRYSLFIIHYFIVLHYSLFIYKGKVTLLVSAHVDI